MTGVGKTENNNMKYDPVEPWFLNFFRLQLL